MKYTEIIVDLVVVHNDKGKGMGIKIEPTPTPMKDLETLRNKYKQEYPNCEIFFGGIIK